MRLITIKFKVLTILFLSFCFASFANSSDKVDKADEKFNPKEMILHHVKDAYGMHIATLNANEDHPIHISIPLPVIVYTEKGFTVFSSSAFHHDYHGHEIVERNGQRFINLHEKVYVLDPGAKQVVLGEDGYASNAHRPKFDLSITRNVFMMWVSIALLLFIFLSASRRYKKSENYVPSGIASFVEPLIVFVRDEIGKPMIGEQKYDRYMPYLLTVFFFIWINNIFGLIPILNGANLSGNIAFTFTLATLTFIITTFSANKNYWEHIFWMPGVPKPIRLILAPIELLGVFIKPLTLMIRLYANMQGGHIVIMSIIGLMFIFYNWIGSSLSFVLAFLLMIIELFVALLQAYIFTILSALYFGFANEEHEH